MVIFRMKDDRSPNVRINAIQKLYTRHYQNHACTMCGAEEALRGKSKPHMQSEQLTCALRGQARKRGRTPGAYNADEKQ